MSKIYGVSVKFFEDSKVINDYNGTIFYFESKLSKSDLNNKLLSEGFKSTWFNTKYGKVRVWIRKDEEMICIGYRSSCNEVVSNTFELKEVYNIQNEYLILGLI